MKLKWVGTWDRLDVGVTESLTPPPGADHVFLVVEMPDPETPDRMLIADNQREKPHLRYASGKGKTPVQFFLRAPA